MGRYILYLLPHRIPRISMPSPRNLDPMNLVSTAGIPSLSGLRPKSVLLDTDRSLVLGIFFQHIPFPTSRTGSLGAGSFLPMCIF